MAGSMCYNSSNSNISLDDEYLHDFEKPLEADLAWPDHRNEKAYEVPEILQKQYPDRHVLKYIINRQTGDKIQQHFHSSLYAIQRLNLLRKLKGKERPITALSFNEKGNLLASGSNDDGVLSIWNWQKEKQIITHDCINPGGRELLFYQLKWLPLDIERFIIASDSNGEVNLIDIHTGSIQMLFRDPHNRHTVATHKDFPCVLLCADDDSNVHSIDVREASATKFTSVKDIDGCFIQLFSIAAHPLNGNEFCVAGNMSCVNIYDRRKPSVCLHQLYPEHMGLNGFRFIDRAIYNHNGTEIIAAYGDEAIYLYDIKNSYETKNYAHKYEGIMRNVNTIKDVNFFGPNSEFIIASSDNGHVYIWDKKTEAVVRWLCTEITVIYFGFLEPHPHAPILASSGNDVCIWAPSPEE